MRFVNQHDENEANVGGECGGAVLVVGGDSVSGGGTRRCEG